MAYIVVQRPRYAAPRRKQLDQPQYVHAQQLGIEEVSNRQPWHIHHRPWLVAASIVAGFIGMRWLLKRKRLIENPRGEKDPKSWMLPLDLGESFIPPGGKAGWAAPPFDTWLLEETGLYWKHARGSAVYQIQRAQAVDLFIALAEAIGRPRWEPPANSIAHYVLKVFAHVAEAAITNIADLILHAKTDKQALQDLWFAIYNPKLTYFDEDGRTFFLQRLRKMPKEKRWRVQWFLENLIWAIEPAKYIGEVTYTDHGREGPRNLCLSEMNSFDEAMALPYREFVAKWAPGPKAIWEEVHGRYPESDMLKGLVNQRSIFDFDPKTYLRAYKYLTSIEVHMSVPDAIRGAVALQFVFGSSWKSWIDAMWARYIDPHDATMWLPTEPSPGLAKFLRQHTLIFSRGESGKRYPILGKPLEELSVIARGWNNLEPNQRHFPFKQVLQLVMTGAYEDIQAPELAIEAARWGTSEAEYKEIEKRWLEGRSGLRSFLPDVDATRGGLHAFLVPKNDPRGLFLGMHTVCCQHPGGAGEACAWWGAERPKSGFYAVEDKSGKIVAQAWAWVHGDVFVFDNIEGPAVQSTETRRTIIDLYGDLAIKILEADSDIIEVRIGETHDRNKGGLIDWGYPTAKSKSFKELIPPPIDFLTETDVPYTDASGKQYIMASATGKKSAYFDSREFEREFVEALKHVLANDDKDQIEMAAKVITGIGINYEIECNLVDRQALDHVTCENVFECRLIIGTTAMDVWNTCIRVRWSDQDLDTTEAEFIPCSIPESLHAAEASHGTLTLIEELGLELQDADDLVTSNALPPEPAKEDQNGNYALVEEDYDGIFRRYSSYDDASYAREMIFQASSIWTTIYERLDDPEEDSKHEHGDELFGWRKAE